MASAAWSTQQLAEFVAAVTAAESEEAAALAVVERAAEALDADAAAIVGGGAVVAEVGYPRGTAPVADLEAVKPGVAGSLLEVPGVGPCATTAVALEHPPGSTLVVARAGVDGLTADESSLLRGMARVASLTIRMQRVLDRERAARGEIERLAHEHAALHRVATLVAEVAPPDIIFAAVAAEVGGVVRGADLVLVSRYEPDEVGKIVGAWSRTEDDHELLGLQFPLGGRNIHTLVFETNRPARVDELVDDATVATAIARETGARSSAGAPIVVSGRLWGVIIVASSREAALPVDAEYRLADFTELVATAIAKVQSREELRTLAEEQTALRRVATLVALPAPPADVFAVVTEEVGRLLSADVTGLVRYDADDTATLVSALNPRGVALPAGDPGPLRGRTVTALVRETGHPVRLDDYATGADTQDPLHTFGVRSAVGVPITVEGRLWGTIIVGSLGDEPPPADTEVRLARFTELVATAVANAQAREELRTIADEQTAQRRVATLIARGETPEAVFDAVTEEVHRLLLADETGLSRYDPDGLWTVLAVRGATTDAIPVGFRLDPGPSMPGVAELLSGRSVRVDAAPRGTLVDDLIQAEQLQAWVASPIVLMGRTWGQIAVFSRQGSLPAGAEKRLANFTELVATALANAQAREELRTIAEEQAALRRVATLVAQGETPEAVFASVAEEVGRLLSLDRAFVSRFEDDTVISVAAWSATGETLPVGLRTPASADTAAGLVRETGRPARIDRYEGEMLVRARKFGIRSTVGAPISVEGRLWGLMLVASTSEDSSPPPDTEERLAAFSELLATAIANAQARGELTASRARIIATADETRRRIERDLHDGAQQRLVSLALQLRAAQAAVPSDLDELARELDDVARGLTGALDDLREFARGIHPAILAEGGLGAALKSLARRSAVPVVLEMRTDARLPEPVEVATYYLVSEALANTAKHAEASAVVVGVETTDGVLLVSVRDDGIGGAGFVPGSGLVGLRDRVEALGGRVALESPRGGGTAVEVELPLRFDAVEASN